MIHLDPSSNDIHHCDRGKVRCTGLPEQLLQQQQQHQKPQPQQQHQRTKLKRQHKFYGDVVNAIMLGAATPMFATRMYADRSTSGLDNFDAVVMVGAVGLSGIFQGLAWKYDSLVFSRLGFLGNCFAGSFMGALRVCSGSIRSIVKFALVFESIILFGTSHIPFLSTYAPTHTVAFQMKSQN